MTEPVSNESSTTPLEAGQPALARPVAYVVVGAVATITLNRPEAMNSLDAATKVALLGAIQRAAADTDVRCVVITGIGRAFSVGQDLREHVEKITTRSPDEVWATVKEEFSPIALGLATMDKPVVAAINGVAAGAGLSIALACDLRVAADTAGFNTAFTAIALSCDTGSSWTLPRLVGRAKAIELLLRPRTVDAIEALDLGLVTQVVPSATLSAEVATLAESLAAGPTLAYASVKQALTYAETHSLEDSLAFEGEQMARTGHSDDHLNAVQSFLKKEKPTFEGR
jgi:2-(1,2-epoxy-1,2-dihydrophenyl)acetyl-CoA isomerase